jgi:ATP-dependent protease ClpP protease subunit
MQREHVRTTRPVARLRAGRNDWYRIENRAGTAEVYLYDEIGYFGVTAEDFVNELRGLDVRKIELHLNSPGGDVFDGVAIYQALKDHPAKVNVTVDSLAASATSFIAQAGDSIAMTRNATMMIHDGAGLCVGNADDMQAMVDLLNKTSDNIADIYAQRAGGSVADWRAAMRAETWYSAQEAVTAGLADSVLGADEADGGSEGVQATWDLSVFAYQGRDSAPAPVIPDPEPVFVFDPAIFRSALQEAVQ